MGIIYKIENRINKKVYIGSAEDRDRRWRVHKSLLRNNKHHSVKLQRSWNKYNGEFDFEVIARCPKEYLIKLEQFFIDFYKASSEGYNIRPIAESNRGRVVSEETREKQRQVKIDNPTKYWSGKKRGKNIGQINGVSKPIVQCDLEDNIIKVWKSNIEASRELNISSNGIFRCCKDKQISYKQFKWKYYASFRSGV